MKKITLGLMMLMMMVLIPVTGASADTGSQGDSYWKYSWGYVTSTEKHTTSISFRYDEITVAASIKIGNNAADVATGYKSANVTASKKAGPYDAHTHSWYSFGK